MYSLFAAAYSISVELWNKFTSGFHRVYGSIPATRHTAMHDFSLIYQSFG